MTISVEFLIYICDSLPPILNLEFYSLKLFCFENYLNSIRLIS